MKKTKLIANDTTRGRKNTVEEKKSWTMNGREK